MNKRKKLYLISQDKNKNYDTYDSFVVCASSINEARHFNMNTGKFDLPDELNVSKYQDYWVGAKDVKVRKIGYSDKTIEKGLVLGSYNAG